MAIVIENPSKTKDAGMDALIRILALFALVVFLLGNTLARL